MPLEIEVDRNGLVGRILERATDLDDKSAVCTVQFERPYTIGMIEYTFEGNEYIGLGCACVQRPDKWSEEKGSDMVLLRAARKIADEIRHDLEKLVAHANDVAALTGLETMTLGAFEGLVNNTEEEE